jgi:ribonucleoside-diphosphate reductase alpha chain
MILPPIPHQRPVPHNLGKETSLTTFFASNSTVVARRQSWIEQSQSVNLFLATPNMETLSNISRRASNKSLQATYYLRTHHASTIEKATTDVKKEARGTIAAGGKTSTAEENVACSIHAMINGAACEACQ